MSFHKKEFFKLTALVIFSMFIVLFGVELVFQISSPIKFQSLINDDTKTWSRGLQSDIFRPSKTLGYEFIPNINLPRWQVKTNSLGMLDKERSKEKAKGIYRIICLGDSTTANSEYAGILEGLLNEDKKGYGFEVWNCGVGGYGAIQYYRELKEKWLRCNPDMVIIGFCLNDFHTTPLIFKEKDSLVGYFPNEELIQKVSPFLLKHSALYRFIIIKLISSKIEPKGSIYKQVGFYLREMNELLLTQRIHFLIVILGLPQQHDSWAIHWKTDYEEIKKVIRDYNIDAIDLVPIFENNNPEGLKKVTGDEVHFNDMGSRLTAQAIYNYIQENMDKPGYSQ